MENFDNYLKSMCTYDPVSGLWILLDNKFMYCSEKQTFKHINSSLTFYILENFKYIRIMFRDLVLDYINSGPYDKSIYRKYTTKKILKIINDT